MLSFPSTLTRRSRPLLLLSLVSTARSLSSIPPPPPLTHPGIHPPITPTSIKPWLKSLKGSIVITGATGGIGSCIVNDLIEGVGEGERIYALSRRVEGSSISKSWDPEIVTPVNWDCSTDDPMPSFLEEGEKVKLIIHTAALLNGSHGPEKNLKSINQTHFLNSLNTNTYSLIKIYQSLLPHLSPPTHFYPTLINLSARVGSITDDKSGGWWSYRISKTASNHAQVLAGVEVNRQRHKCNFLSVHPGTTYTDLSSPFVKGVGGKVHSKEFTAERILELVAGCEEEGSGGFYDWTGQSLPF